MKKHAEIAGAGFAGLATATALCQHGWSVRVHEANSELRELGAGIFLWGNAIRVLRLLGIHDEVRAGAHAAPFLELRVDGRSQTRDQTNSPGTTQMWTMSRQHLYSQVLDAAVRSGVDIVTDSRVTGADPAGELKLADGKTLRADLVLGADGVRSAVRPYIGTRECRRQYDDGIIRVLTPRMSNIGGEWDHVIDFWALGEQHLRVLYVPCNETTLYMAMMASTTNKRASTIPFDRALWSEAFPILKPFIERVHPGERYDRYEATSLDRWTLGKLALIGDAAHPMPPTLGQGAGFAMMNGVALAKAVSATSNIEQALRDWEISERAMTDRTQQRAEELAAMGSARVSITIADMEPEAANYVPAGLPV